MNLKGIKYLLKLTSLIIGVIGTSLLLSAFNFHHVSTKNSIEDAFLKTEKSVISTPISENHLLELIDETEEEEEEENAGDWDQINDLSQNQKPSFFSSTIPRKVSPPAFKFAGQEPIKWYLLYDVFRL